MQIDVSLPHHMEISDVFLKLIIIFIVAESLVQLEKKKNRNSLTIIKEVFLEIVQDPQENTFAGASF